MEPAGSRWILALETATQVPVVAGRRVMISPTFELIANDSLAERIRYEGEARLDAQIGRNESRLSLQNWLKLPPGYNPRTLEMAQRWRAEGEASVPALVDRAMDWLRRDRFTYTLTPPLLGRHSVDEFLFDTKAGFCEHFSSAFVVLMRALGVPARVVTGYQGAERNDADNYWIVRQSNAHAWAEVWSEGAGWIRVDPTSAVAPDRIERGSARAFDQQNRARSGFGSQDWLRGWRLSLDALTHNWNQWVLAYDKSRQQSLLNRFGIDITDWREAAGAIAGVLGLLLGAVALATLRPRTTKDPVERQFDEFCQRLAAIGAERFPHETANNYLYRIERLLDPEQSALAHDIVATYNRLRYDLGSSQRDILDHLKRMVRAFRP
jgi:transglutaminase-like putative cysteine protease